jgi:Uma2 family endonuclease
MPEGGEHQLRCLLLWQSVKRAFGKSVLIASDQFLYWDPTDPKKRLAPDLAVRMGTPAAILKTWKTWELGAPHVGVEIVSDSDRADGIFAQKLERYRQAGIAEVVRFDAEDRERPIRLWDLLDGDLVERRLSTPEARICDALGLYWCAARGPEVGLTLRLARDPMGVVILPSTDETLDAALSAKDAALSAKDAALARVAELEAELARRR